MTPNASSAASEPARPPASRIVTTHCNRAAAQRSAATGVERERTGKRRAGKEGSVSTANKHRFAIAAHTHMYTHAHKIKRVQNKCTHTKMALSDRSLTSSTLST